MGMFLLTLQKIPVSLSFIVTEIWPGQNTNLKSVFFGQNFQNFWFLEIWLGQESVTHGRREEQYMSPAGGDI